jgi:hypothetical protein
MVYLRVMLAKRAWMIVPLLAAAACSSNADSNGDAGVDAGDDPSLVGVWRVDSGTLVGLEGLDAITYIELATGDDAGSGTLYGNVNGINGCATITYAKLGDGALSLQSSNTFPLVLRLFDFEDADTLVLTDERGGEARLLRAGAVPDSALCGEAELVESFNVPVPPEYAVGLIWDGALLQYVGSDGNLYTIDPSNGVVGSTGPAPSNGQYDRLSAFESGDFWAHCWCGNNGTLRRITSGGVEVDVVDTGAELGNSINIRAAARTTSHLFIAGYSFDDDVNVILQVNAEGEPDVLANKVTFPPGVEAMTDRGNELWAITRGLGYVVVQLDPATQRAVQTYNIPSGYSPLGLAFANQSLFLLAADEVEGTPVVLELNLP